MPMVLKNATLSTGWAVVSSCTLRNRSRPASTRRANISPPTTAAGMFRRSSHPIRFRSSSPSRKSTAARLKVCSRSSFTASIRGGYAGRLD